MSMSIEDATKTVDRCLAVMSGRSREMTLHDALARYNRAQLELNWASDAEVAAYAFSLRYCAICGEPEGSAYAKHCCTDDQMIEDGW